MQLCTSHAEEKLQNHSYLLKIFQTMQFLSRQGLPLRGDQNDQESNLIQLMKLRETDNPNIIKVALNQLYEALLLRCSY